MGTGAVRETRERMALGRGGVLNVIKFKLIKHLENQENSWNIGSAVICDGYAQFYQKQTWSPVDTHILVQGFRQKPGNRKVRTRTYVS